MDSARAGRAACKASVQFGSFAAFFERSGTKRVCSEAVSTARGNRRQQHVSAETSECPAGKAMVVRRVRGSGKPHRFFRVALRLSQF